MMKAGGLVFLLFVFSFGLAKECKQHRPYYQDRERGWFWREVCVEEKAKQEGKKEEKREEKRELPTKVVIPWDRLNRMSPKEIEELEKSARDIAIMYPTRENILEHARLIRWIRDRSIKYAKLYDYYIKQDPTLSYTRPPTALPVRDALIVYRERERKRVLRSLAGKMGIIVVESRDCFECHAYRNTVIQYIPKEWGWDYRIVSKEENPYIVQTLGSENFPDTFLVINEKGYPRFIRLASGFRTLGQLEDQLFMTLYMEGYIKDENLVVY